MFALFQNGGYRNPPFQGGKDDIEYYFAVL
jgi:hypothetical protein